MYNGVIRKNSLSKHHYTKSAHSFGESQNVLVMGAPFEHFSSKPTTQYATNTKSSTGHSRSPNKQKIDDSITEWLKINELLLNFDKILHRTILSSCSFQQEKNLPTNTP